MDDPVRPDEGGEAPCYAHLFPPDGPPRPAVLFVCPDDAGLALMAARLAVLISAGRAEAHSAGIVPAGVVRPAVAAAMAEVGLDLSRAVPTGFDQAQLGGVDVAVFMGCPPSPAPHGVEVLSWDITLPGDDDPAAMRATRDRVTQLVRELLTRRGVRTVHAH